MLNQSVLLGLTKCVGALAVAAAVFWETAESSGGETSEIVVHVMAEAVEVIVDDSRFWVAERLQQPHRLPASTRQA